MPQNNKPDWRNKNDYPPIDGTSLDRWAFEFLMRNQSFVSEFIVAENTKYSESPLMGWNKTPVGKVLKKYGVRIPILPEWREKTGGDSPFVFEAHPISMFSHKCEIEEAGSIFTEGAIGRSYYIRECFPNTQLLEFDLSQPINPQIERAKKMLDTNQKQFVGDQEADKNSRIKIIKKNIFRLFPFYLRVLDADAAGAVDKDICNVLSDDHFKGVDQDTLDNWRKESARLRDGGYRNIVKNPEAKKRKA